MLEGAPETADARRHAARCAPAAVGRVHGHGDRRGPLHGLGLPLSILRGFPRLRGRGILVLVEGRAPGDPLVAGGLRLAAHAAEQDRMPVLVECRVEDAVALAAVFRDLALLLLIGLRVGGLRVGEQRTERVVLDDGRPRGALGQGPHGRRLPRLARLRRRHVLARAPAAEAEVRADLGAPAGQPAPGGRRVLRPHRLQVIHAAAAAVIDGPFVQVLR